MIIGAGLIFIATNINLLNSFYKLTALEGVHHTGLFIISYAAVMIYILVM